MKNDLKFLEDLNNKYNNQFDTTYLEKNPDRYCHFYVKCNIHGKVSNRKQRLLSHGCPKCREEKDRLLRYEKYFNSLPQHKKDNFIIKEDSFKNTHDLIEIYCKEHNFWFKRSPELYKTSLTCCDKGLAKYRSELLRLPLETFIQKANTVHNNSYDYSKVTFENLHEYITVICKNHNYEFTCEANSHLKGWGFCPKCSEENKDRIYAPVLGKYVIKSLITTEEIIQRFKKVHGDKFNYSKVNYIHSDEPVIVICQRNHEFLTTVYNHETLKAGCKTCQYENNTVSVEDFLKRIPESKKDFKIILESYKGMTKICDFVCPQGHSYKTKPKSFLTSKRTGCCPECLKEFSTSNYEYDLLNFFSKYTKNIIHSYKPPWLLGKELDIYLPDYNLAIEFNGTYYHQYNPNSTPHVHKEYHLEKYLICKQNNINLIHIFEHENLNKWKRKLRLYLSNMDKYIITFTNQKRTVDDFINYGLSKLSIK